MNGIVEDIRRNRVVHICGIVKKIDNARNNYFNGKFIQKIIQNEIHLVLGNKVK